MASINLTFTQNEYGSCTEFKIRDHVERESIEVSITQNRNKKGETLAKKNEEVSG